MTDTVVTNANSAACDTRENVLMVISLMHCQAERYPLTIAHDHDLRAARLRHAGDQVTFVHTAVYRAAIELFDHIARAQTCGKQRRRRCSADAKTAAVEAGNRSAPKTTWA